MARFSSCTDVNVLRFLVFKPSPEALPKQHSPPDLDPGCLGAYASIAVSKPLGLSFDAALSSGKNFTRWRHFKQQNE